MEHIEEILSNTQHTNSDADVKETMNDIINGMKQMLRMIRVSLQNSTPSNVLSSIEPFIQSAVHKAYSEDLRNKEKRIEALQKIIMSNQTKLEDAELYSKHLENRISSLEECNRQHVDDQMEVHSDDTNEISSPVEDIIVDGLTDDTNNTPDEEISDSGSLTQSTQPTLDSSMSQLSNDVDAVIEDINNTLGPTVPDLNNHVSKTEETLMKILKTYQQQEDEKTKRTVLFSNIDYPDVPEGINDTMNFWPKLRMQLRCLGLEDIMTGAEKIIKLKSGSLRITYKSPSDARIIINRLRAIIGHMKSYRRNNEGLYENSYGHAMDDDMVSSVLKIKFTRLIPNRFNAERKKLQKLGNYLKKKKKIQYFDMHVLHNHVVLKTKWREQEMQASGRIHYTKKFTHYTVDQAEDILSGVLEVDERRDRNSSSLIRAH